MSEPTMPTADAPRCEPMTLEAIKSALHGDLCFPVERQGTRYLVGYGESGVFAWLDNDDEDGKSVVRFGDINPWTARAYEGVAERIRDWLGGSNGPA